ncbi:MAG TPA: plastocyanin/azurin family copper-binding protein [Solirubrobacteraceae bacterium]|nr:plastocyanin/azurin family copper-binding protein [Solirubrobacteraceae bacterium]
MPRLFAAAAVAALAAVLAVPALAVDQSVVARADDLFGPREVAVKPGEKVTFTNAGGDHNVVWNDGTASQPPSAVPPSQWPAGGVSRTFSRAGRYRYYCEAHGDRSSNFGMYGYVHVNAAGVLPPVVSRLTAADTATGVRVGFRSTRAGTARATFLRRVSGVFRRRWTITFAARRGANSRSIVRSVPAGSYRVELVLTDANGVRSEKRTRNFTVR